MKLTGEQKAIVAEYGHLFNNTGGNDVVELIEREDVNYFNNAVVAELQGCCLSQVVLLQRLKREGLLHLHPECNAKKRGAVTKEVVKKHCSPAPSAEELYIALREALELQKHYAELLNMHDGGQRRSEVFTSPETWIARLRETGDL